MDQLTPGELPLRSNAQPMTVRTITKLDQRSMVWACDGIATEVEALGPFMALLMIIGVVGITWMMLNGAVGGDADPSTKVILWSAWVFGVILCGGLTIYELKISLFSTYGDVHFNRHTGKVYTSENKLALQMDWRHIRPMAVANVGPLQLGAPTLMSLMLVEYEPDQPSVWKARFTVAGPLPSREGCQQVWELIRRYMEDPPEAMPKLEVTSGGRDWTSVLIAFGPMAGAKTPSRFLAELRARNWSPPINPLTVAWWIIAWPHPLSMTLYAKYRRKAKLPTEWIRAETPSAGENNPYRSGGLDPAEASGRRKAAIIIGATSLLCIALGMLLWGFLLWAGLFSHN